MTQDILFTEEGQLGVVTLNRAAALNALNFPMILALREQLESWKKDSRIKAVVVRALPGTAFCAGGDVRWLYQLGVARISEQMEFFKQEYCLNHLIHHLGKPYIALMDGVTMGGGVGISLHGSHPVASERFVFAMPETGIGFFPDIGASHLLTQCRDSLGIYLGLTGARLGAQDALNAGLIRQVVAADNMPHILDALINEDLSEQAYQKVDACLSTFAYVPDATEPSQLHPLIATCFSAPDIEGICAALDRAKDPWADKVLNTLQQKSPLSLKITLTQLQQAKHSSLAECLNMDFTLVNQFMRGRDFYEGVRALLIDKDKKPHWSPERLDLISEQQVKDYFTTSAQEALNF